jgi:hypothetical protein
MDGSCRSQAFGRNDGWSGEVLNTETIDSGLHPAAADVRRAAHNTVSYGALAKPVTSLGHSSP